MTKTGAVMALAALALLTLSSSAARAERPRIAVMELSAPKVAPDLRQRATRAVQEGLLASGADVVEGMPAAATGPGGAPCDGSGCITAVAKASVANYVVRGTLEIEGRTYGLRLEILEGKSGSLVESREDRCEICTEGEALEMAGVSASALKVQAFKKGGAPATMAAAAPALSTPAPAALIATPAAAAAPDHRRLGWIGVGAGVVAVAAGVWLLSLDGHADCSVKADTCMNRYSTGVGGLTSLGVGVIAAATGVLVLSGKF